MPREGGEARGMYREYDSIAFNWELKESLRPAGGAGGGGEKPHARREVTSTHPPAP